MNYKELYKYINQLFNQYFNKYRMRLEDKEDLIQDTIIKLFKKEQEGVLSPVIEKNKNYIFISIKNEIHYRLYTKKNLVDYSPDFNDTMILSHSTIENDMDKEIRYNQLKNILKSNKFNDYERTIIDLTFNGYELQDIGKELQLEERKIYSIHTNLKDKLKFKLFPIYKYLLVYENGNTIGIKSQNELSRKTGMSKDKILLGFKLGKTKYKNYEIIKL
jgi:RNA polymerase sigma factor (sigma-70 family)